MKSELIHCEHGFPAYFNDDSKTLILGSFPSVKSRAEAFYYAHPQNRFWKVLAGIYHEPTPLELSEKTDFLKRRRIALWDVIESCDIVGSSDSSIKNALPTDIRVLLFECQIEKIILNGRTAERCFNKFQSGIDVPVYTLPSTSPANAQYSLERLIAEWSEKII